MAGGLQKKKRESVGKALPGKKKKRATKVGSIKKTY